MVEYNPKESTVRTKGNGCSRFRIILRPSERSRDLSADSAEARISAPTDENETLLCFPLYQPRVWKIELWKKIPVKNPV